MTQSRFFSVDDLAHLPRPAWMIEGLFEAKSLVMLAGPPGCYKSFMAIDWMLCMATGRPWNDKAAAESKVLYVLGEGRASLLKRIQTWCTYHKVTEDEKNKLAVNFKVTFDVPAMSLKPSVDNLLSGLLDVQFKPDLICIDTFARSFVGQDENSQKDTGMWIEQAERLREIGYTVLILHHTAKNTEFGYKYRGSSVIHGAVDTAMIQTREGDSGVSLKITKQKDHDEGKAMKFNRVVVKTGSDDEEGSVVLVPAVLLDDRFTEGASKVPPIPHIDSRMQSLLYDDRFASDTDRAKVLQKEYGLVSLDAAKMRISVKRKSMVTVGWLPPEPVEVQAEPVRNVVRSDDAEDPHLTGLKSMAAMSWRL